MVDIKLVESGRGALQCAPTGNLLEMNGYQFSYSIYHRRFRQPLHTSHGVWEIRVGIIIQLTDELGVSHAGEIAPIPWFGSESIEQAIDYCQQIGDRITPAQIYQIPDTLPACQFGFGTALILPSVILPSLDGLGVSYPLPPHTCLGKVLYLGKAQDRTFRSPLTPHPSSLSWKGALLGETPRPHFPLPPPPSPLTPISALLPTGATAMDAWRPLWSQGYTTFKWKIGVVAIAQEVAMWRELMAALPPLAKLRLDANGGLTGAEAEQWLQICEGESRIEFIEQPFAPDLIAETIALTKIYTTPIALDESIATFDRLQSVYQQGWSGIYVIKPGISGFPWRLAEFITQHQLDVVFSSVLETSIGRNAAFQLAAGLNLNRAMGFGVDLLIDN